jgi:hypothetical protein
VPIDTLKMACAWGGASVAGARIAAQLSGLQLEGGTFDGTKLGDVSESSPKYACVCVCVCVCACVRVCVCACVCVCS